MDTLVVTVNEAGHIARALELLREAIRRAPNQRLWTRHSGNNDAGFLLPHCSVDAEFVKMERNVAMGEFSLRDAVQEGVLEEMCSVLTFAVGRHFFLIFNIVHMLETSDKTTVPALTSLYRDTIFNKDLLKIWWNPQSNILVLDATIAHMFQQKPRDTYAHTRYGTKHATSINPKWRIKRNHFQNKRPTDLYFPTHDVDCELHNRGCNEQGITCCCRLGNIDIAALFSHFCRMHGLSGTLPKLPWNEVRYKFRYSDLLEAMLSEDRLYPILDHMKDRAGKTGKSKDAFYQDVDMPGMELEDDVMAYNIGDVAGQNMILELLTASDDKDFVAGRMSAFSRVYCYGSSERKCPQRPSEFGSVGGIQLWDDNPKSFEDTNFDPDLEEGDVKIPPKAELYRTHGLTPWEHDRRVGHMRSLPAIDLSIGDTHYSGAYMRPFDAQLKAGYLEKDILASMHDPTKMWVSKECVQAVNSIYEDPIVRAGHTHAEALVEFLQPSQANGTSLPPPGFGAAPATPCGLPLWLNRVPGAGLGQARNMFNTFKQSSSAAGEHLGELQALPQTTGWLSENVGSSEILLDEAVAAQCGWPEWVQHDKWTMASAAQYHTECTVEKEQQMITDEGLPYSLDTRDFFDLEGREYRRRITRGQLWNHLDFQPKLTLAPDGSVKSLACLQLEVLRNHKEIQDDKGFQEVVRKRKRLGF